MLRIKLGDRFHGFLRKHFFSQLHRRVASISGRANMVCSDAVYI